MSAKIIALIVAALGLGFAGTYFATSGDCGGTCPIAKFLHGDSGNSNACCTPASDCCTPASDCCSPPQGCCTKSCCADKTEPVSTKAVPDCCYPGSPCCTGQGGDCCIMGKTQISTETVPACCYPGSPCCEGPDCCLKK